MKNLFCIISALLIINAFLASSYAIEAGAILGLWLFDENKGAAVADSSANGRNGTIKGDIKWVKGKLDSALQFSGQAGNYVIIPHDDALSVKTFSATAWVNLVNKGAYQALVEKSEVAGDVRNFYLAVTDGGIEPLQNKGPITIGTTNDAGGEPAQGIIDEVGVFNRGLTEAEVKAIMQNGLKNSALAVESAEKLATTWGKIK